MAMVYYIHVFSLILEQDVCICCCCCLNIINLSDLSTQDLSVLIKTCRE